MSISVKNCALLKLLQANILPAHLASSHPAKQSVSGFSNIFFDGDGTLTYLPTPNLEDLSLRFVSPFSQNLHITVELTKDLTGIAFRDVKRPTTLRHIIVLVKCDTTLHLFYEAKQIVDKKSLPRVRIELTTFRFQL